MSNSTNSTANLLGGGGGGDDGNNSTAQTLASGSQDIAALAGLFATDGVETNALASDTGYGTVISATLSILGILGLVKSSVKLALGPDRCRVSGWSTDSMRGIFGYSERDSQRVTGIDVFPVLHVDVEFSEDCVRLIKRMRKYDSDRIPQINVGSTTYPKRPTSRYGYTLFNAGNLAKDRSFTQHPLLIWSLAFLCAGITTWLIAIVPTARGAATLPYSRNTSDWVFWVGTVGLHFSLVAMISPTLYHSYLTTRPSQYFNPEIFDILTRKHDWTVSPKTKRFSFVRRKYDGNGVQVLHFRGQAPNFESKIFAGFMFTMSALCVVSYICQYALLKEASNTDAAVWIGIQAGLALLRALYWICDPAFDDPKTNQTELLGFDNQWFDPFSLMRILTSFMDDVGEKADQYREMTIPMWAFKYLQQTPVGQIIQDCERKKSASPRPSVHRFPSLPHHHEAGLNDIYVPEIRLDVLIYMNLEKQEDLDDYHEKFADLNVRLLLEPTEPVRPMLLFANDRDNWLHISRETFYKDWSHWTRVESPSDQGSDNQWKWQWREGKFARQGFEDKYRWAVSWPDGDVSPPSVGPTQVVLDFFEYAQDLDSKAVFRRACCSEIRIDQTNLPIPRSYGLSRRLTTSEFTPGNRHEPMHWLRINKNACKGRQPELRRYDIMPLVDPEGAYYFAREFIGRTKEINRLWWLDMERQFLPPIRHILACFGVATSRLDEGFVGETLKDECMGTLEDYGAFETIAVPPKEQEDMQPNPEAGLEAVVSADSSAMSPLRETIRVGSEKDVDIEKA